MIRITAVSSESAEVQLAAGAGARMVGGPGDGRDFSGDTNVLFLIDIDLAVELWF